MRKLKSSENAKVSGGCYGPLKPGTALIRTIDSKGNIDPNYLALNPDYNPGSQMMSTYGEEIVPLADAKQYDLNIIASGKEL